MKSSVLSSFLFIAALSIVINVGIFLGLKWILEVLQTPESLLDMMYEYVFVIFWGIFFVFLYNYFAFLLRAIGDSVTPLWFLGIASVLNIVLDLIFVVVFKWGIGGAALATVISQAVSGIGIGIFTWMKLKSKIFYSAYSVDDSENTNLWRKIKKATPEVVRFSVAASIQQSVMNFGILMIQGLINSFGTVVMAAYAAAVKIDSLAYMPAQEFSNAFSIFVSQNSGAGERERVQQSVRTAFRISIIFCLTISTLIFILAPYLMLFFVSPSEVEIIRVGAEYLRVEGACYCGIGILFLLYAYYRGIGKPEMSVVLTIISLGTRVILSYTLAPVFGVLAIWLSIPIGWFLADVTGVIYGRIGVKNWKFE